MTRDHATHAEADDLQKPNLKTLTKQEFGRKIYNMLMEKGWSQSELARRSDLPRDSISVYIRGKSFPTPSSLAKLAKAFNLDPVEMLPNHTVSSVERDQDSAFSINSSSVDPGKAFVRVNRVVSFETAMKIGQLLADEDARRAGSSDETPA
jgi:transcriptional regulator with XRE-family HTH domain